MMQEEVLYPIFLQILFKIVETPPEIEYLSKIFYECRNGKLPANPLAIMSNDSLMDPSRVPKNKHFLNS